MNNSSVSIYIHWPFCASKCPYCDFNSHVSSAIDHQMWLEGYRREIEHYKELLGPRHIKSVFFGGGTPSLMEPFVAEGILNAIAEHFVLEPGTEVTLESNPGSVDFNKFKAFNDAGINRVSIGVQSLNGQDLEFLGRQHSVEEALKAIEIGQSIFERVSFDLIYARPGQSVAAWEEELTQALSYGTEHLSLYQLTIEPHTPFYTQYQRGEFVLPDEETSATLLEATYQMASEKGLHAYEVSNLAKPGAESQHNLTYWRYQDYIGIGPGAHGRLSFMEDGRMQRYATRAHRAPSVWLERVLKDGQSGHTKERLEPRARVMEAVLMGLRLTQGIPYQKIEGEAGAPIESVLDMEILRNLQDDGYLLEETHVLRATQKGRMVLDALLPRLFIDERVAA